jgi:tetrahydromethanopterin S-methyltransferase subunit B
MSSLFESRHWFRELAATLGIFVTASGLSSFFFGFPLGLAVGLGATILIIWLLHRRAMRIRGQSGTSQATE